MDPIKQHEAQHHCRVITADLAPPDGLASIQCVPRSGPDTRDLYVDVYNCRAEIAEMVDHPNHSSSARFLNLDLLPARSQKAAVRLIATIIYDENDGAINLSGHYRLQTDRSRKSLVALVERAEGLAARKRLDAWS